MGYQVGGVTTELGYGCGFTIGKKVVGPKPNRPDR